MDNFCLPIIATLDTEITSVWNTIPIIADSQRYKLGTMSCIWTVRMLEFGYFSNCWLPPNQIRSTRSLSDTFSQSTNCKAIFYIPHPGWAAIEIANGRKLFSKWLLNFDKGMFYFAKHCTAKEKRVVQDLNCDGPTFGMCISKKQWTSLYPP